MPIRGEDVMVESPSQTDSEKNTKKRRRIPRACDRCRLKKSKCDGLNPCQSCKVTDSVCLFRTRRNRDAKGYYWYMRDITDEALIRLYWACRERTGFPGHAIDETEGRITAHAILEGLGLTRPLDDDTANHGSRSGPTRAAPFPSQALRPETPTPPLTPDDSFTSGTISGADSRMNSTSTIDPGEVSEGTRLQRQFQKQFQVPTFSATQSKVLLPQTHVEGISMDTASYNYAYMHSHSGEMSRAPVHSDASRFDVPPALRVAPPPEAYPGDGLMSSEFFDFQTVVITPGLHLEHFDFTYTHEFTPIETPDLAVFPA